MKVMRTLVCGFVLGLSVSASAWALEPEDVILMVQSGVEESAIINMVRGQKLSRPLSAREVVILNSGGASPALLECLTRPDMSAALSIVDSTPIVVADPTPIVVADPTPIVVAPSQPSVVVTAPPTVYYYPDYYSYPWYSWPRYSYPRQGSSYYFGFSWNNHGWRDRRVGIAPPRGGPRHGIRPPSSGGFRPGGPGGPRPGGPRPGGHHPGGPRPGGRR